MIFSMKHACLLVNASNFILETLMLLVDNLANTKLCKIPDKTESQPCGYSSKTS